MSVRAMSRVWAAAISPPTSKLALLALADWCNDEGDSLHPSLQAIAAKVGVSRSQAQRLVRGFIERGLLSVVANRSGGAPGTTPHYRLNVEAISKLRRTDSADAARTDSADAGDGSHGRFGRVAPMRRTGSTGAAQTTSNHHEPSINTNGKRKAKRLQTEMPPNFAVTAEVATWAAERGFDRLEEHLDAFKLTAEAKGYTYANWSAAFQRAVKDDWAKLRIPTSRNSASSATTSLLHADEDLREVAS